MPSIRATWLTLEKAECPVFIPKRKTEQAAMNLPNFADDFRIRELLDISKSNLDAVDRSRLDGHTVIGMDNFAKLKVSTVFAAIAIESSINHFYQTHCLLVHTPYLQSFVAELTKRFLRATSYEKIDFLRKCWSSPFPDDLIKDVKRLLDIRNEVIHEKWIAVSHDDRSHGVQKLRNKELSRDEIQHMERHYEIAVDFLSRFWTPGNKELQQGVTSG